MVKPLKKHEATWISTPFVYLRLVLVLQVILHVTHLVVGGEQVFHVDPSALFYPVDMDGINSELPGLAPSL
jgi:hypothetical protein